MISDDPLPTFSGAQNSPPYSEGEEYPSGRSWWYGSDTWSSQRFEKTEFIFHSWDMSPGGPRGCALPGAVAEGQETCRKDAEREGRTSPGQGSESADGSSLHRQENRLRFCKNRGAERSFTCPGTANSTARTRTHTFSLPAQPEFQHIAPFTTTLPIHPGRHITPHSPQA